MIFAADIGNSNITIGLFNDGELLEVHRLDSETGFSVNDWENEIRNKINAESIEGCIISSVVNEITDNFKQACDNVFERESLNLSAHMNLGINIKTEKPESIGADRLANAFGALKYNLPVIVVDAGTAVTFDVVDKDKTFIGGIIMPGVDVQLKSLYEKTSKLPKIEPKEIEKVIGYDTETCILSGVIRGVACAIDGLIIQCEEELGEKATVIGTGGQIELISKYMKRKFDHADKNYTLKSLFGIYCKVRGINGKRF